LSITAEAYADGGLNLAGWFDAAAAFPDARDLTVSINQLELGGGMIDLTDFTLSPVLHMNVNQLTGSVSGLQFECMSLRSAGEPVARDTRPGMHTSRQPDETCRLNPRHPVSFRLQGNIDDSGTGELAGRIQQGFPGLQSEVRVKLKDMNFGMLSPYSASYLGRQIVAGTFDSDLVYFIRNGRFVGRHHVRFSNAALGEKVPTLRARVLPLDLAVALLQDSDDRIYLSMPFSGKLDEEKGMEVRTAAITAITDVLVDIVDEPFNTLGELVGIEGNTLKYVPFGPGSAAVTPDVLDTLIAVSEGLKQRPLLGLGIAGRYDPEVDRDALALQQIRLHVSLAANTGPPGETLDFSDPGIQEVLDEFAQARLGAGAGQPGADTEGHYKNIFMALVREEDVAASALESLARYRRQSIVDQLTRLGISEDRLISIDPAGGYSSDRSHARAELGLMSYQQ
jgi:hypothetical protein